MANLRLALLVGSRIAPGDPVHGSPPSRSAASGRALRYIPASGQYRFSLTLISNLVPVCNAQSRRA
jgi:hypothetical protein